MTNLSVCDTFKFASLPPQAEQGGGGNNRSRLVLYFLLSQVMATKE